MESRFAIRVVIALLVMEAIVPALAANAFVAESGAALRAVGVLPIILALGLWAGRRIAQVLTRGYAGLQVFVACGILVLALFDSHAPFTVGGFRYTIPRVAGLTVMSLLALSGWWQWRLLGRRDVNAQFASASW